MVLLDKIRAAIHARTAPKAPKSTALQPVSKAALVRQNGTWSQVIFDNSAIVRRYVYHCNGCGQNYEYSPDEKSVIEIHKCGCGREFNLLFSLDAVNDDGTTKVRQDELAHRLNNLAIQRVNSTPQQPRVLAVGNDAPRVQWGGPVDRARDLAFERGDPGLMGPGDMPLPRRR
jgi:hypothetical protein